jgi:hypothetical protein
MLKVSPLEKNERSVHGNIELKRDNKSAVCTAGGKEFQQSMDLLMKEE